MGCSVDVAMGPDYVGDCFPSQRLPTRTLQGEVNVVSGPERRMTLSAILHRQTQSHRSSCRRSSKMTTEAPFVLKPAGRRAASAQTAEGPIVADECA